MANWTCTICLEDLQQEPTCSPSTCGHVLHSKCMKDWVKKNPRCPVCNARVSTRGMRELYFSEDVGDSLKTEKEALERKVFGIPTGIFGTWGFSDTGIPNLRSDFRYLDSDFPDSDASLTLRGNGTKSPGFGALIGFRLRGSQR
ncbi:ring finger domain-containing protein [Ditylenchus destructor]|nr:ring finger domain-containing protein [Ditylenchus destructor]